MDTIDNRNGCFYRALPDEPIFVLLARDPCFAETVRWWVTLRQALIGQGKKPLEDHETLGDALRTAEAGVVWRADATDPATYGQTPRWKTEEVPARELAPVARRIRSEELPEREGRLAFILEKRIATYDDDAEVTIKVGDLRRIIAEETISEAQRHTVETIQSLIPPHQQAAVIADEIREWVGDRDTDRAKELLRIAERVRNIHSEVTPFIAVDLAAKVSVGLRQVVGDYIKEVNNSTWPNTRKARMLAIADRIGGYASELEAGRMTGERLGTRRLGKSPLLAMPYEPDSPAAMLAGGDAYAAVAETVRADSDTVDVTDVPDLPPHRFAMFNKGNEWAYGRGLEISPQHIPAMLDRMEADGWHLVSAIGSKADEVGMLFYRRQPSAFELAHGIGGEFEPAPRPDTRPLEWPQQHLLGHMGAWTVWVQKDMPEDLRACLRDAIANGPCGAGGMGRGLEP